MVCQFPPRLLLFGMAEGFSIVLLRHRNPPDYWAGVPESSRPRIVVAPAMLPSCPGEIPRSASRTARATDIADPLSPRVPVALRARRACELFSGDSSHRPTPVVKDVWNHSGS
jgi:hypothetical protein